MHFPSDESMKNLTLDTWISDGASYLRDLREHADLWERPTRESLDRHMAGARVFHDHDGLLVEIQSATEYLQRAHMTLARLRLHFARGELEPFASLSGAIGAATTSAAKACAELAIAADLLHSRHPPRTRALTLQRSAVTLAYAYLGEINPRGVRDAAKKMLLEAGIEQPSDRSLSAWIREEKSK